MEEDGDDNAERRTAELEFVASAYGPDEAWISESVVHRRLNADGVSFLLELRMTQFYPQSDFLQISGHVEDEKTTDLKAAYNALPKLLHVCREAATSLPGEEAIFTVLTQADEWIQESWDKNGDSQKITREETSVTAPSSTYTICRYVIYSHHIISKVKRTDIKCLASELQLTGYMKIGWPGVILVEGEEGGCQAFYDHIRRWAWQYLVLRGESIDPIPRSSSLNSERKFSQFSEVDNLSIVAERCRAVGRESLFLSIMKQQSTDSLHTSITDSDGLYGALVLVDHMNDAKSYRKWLRSSCNHLDVVLILKQCFPNQDFRRKPCILVGLVGSSSQVSVFLKRWRTSYVDIDSRGKPCLERMMTILVEGPVFVDFSVVELSDLSSESHLNTTKEKLLELFKSCRLQAWYEIFPRIIA
jgi:hypothetical protein